MIFIGDPIVNKKHIYLKLLNKLQIGRLAAALLVLFEIWLFGQHISHEVVYPRFCCRCCSYKIGNISLKDLPFNISPVLLAAPLATLL